MSDDDEPLGGERWLTAAEVAEALRLPIKSFYGQRSAGRGPRGYRIGKRLVFAESDVLAWLEAHRDDAPSHNGNGRG